MSGGSVDIRQRIEAPAGSVAAYIKDFRNARDWMVGVEDVERLAEDVYRLTLETPVGRVEPEVRMLEQEEGRIRWVYTSGIEGEGMVEVSPAGESSCTVSYTGEFHLKRRLLDRVVHLAGAERFARRNGERSLVRLKYLMEARRYA